jgi:hypothetical protein
VPPTEESGLQATEKGSLGMTATSESLHERLLRAAKNAGYVQKSSRNTGQGYNYAGDEAITEKFREALLEEGLLAYPDHMEFVRIDVIPREGKDVPNVLVALKGNFVISDGTDSIFVESLGQGIDIGDKAVFKAMTGMRKYAFRNAVMMATGDDPEAARDDEKKGSSTKAAVSQSAEQADSSKSEETPEEKLARGKRAIFAKQKEIGLSKEGLAALRLKVTGKQSSRQFTIDDVNAMLKAMKDPAQVAAAVTGGEVVGEGAAA